MEISNEKTFFVVKILFICKKTGESETERAHEWGGEGQREK